MSVFCIVLTVSNLLPLDLFALTSGPTAPEATSFEPVDTTDMVNLSSGDLAYNISLIEVPGPAGSYPLSLSYHAGIQPNEDASWVGLGWTLNPGAITRNVNGYADDYNNIEDVNRFYWDGGTTKTYTAGLTYGTQGSGASLSVGLAYSQDTFQGSGLGINTGFGAGVVDVSFGIDGYGNPSGGVGLSAGKSVDIGKGSVAALSIGGGIGLSTNGSSTSSSASGGVSVSHRNDELDKDGNVAKRGDSNFRGNLLGASISNGKSGTSGAVGVGGTRVGRNSKSGRVSTSSSGLTIPIPTPVPGLSFSLGYEKQRYWIDETENTLTNGVLHFPSGSVTKDYLDDHAFDVYSLKNPDDRTYFQHDPERSLGGSFPGYDNYFVHAQGVVGSFRPYLFQKFLFRKNKYETQQDNSKYYQSINYVMGNDPKPAEFRFINDFSNRYEYNPVSVTNNPASTTNPISFSFSGSPVTGENGNDGYLAASNNLPGSRHIVYLTNNDILTNSAKKTGSGFMDAQATGFNRSGQNADLIGGYVITNESGVKYHFALPAMSSKEYFYSENTDQVLTFNEFKKEAPYAYTWYITGVTGPDYVDRGPTGPADGIMNEYDWGYWVQFEYGKWTDQYAWRNPGEDMQPDLDTKFKNFSEGIKELYYLDAIRTATHTAFFVKDIRNDAKGSIRYLRNIQYEKENISGGSKVGGYLPKSATCVCLKGDFDPGYSDVGSLNYFARPASALKLSKVLLFDNRDLPTTVPKDQGSQFAVSNSYNWTVQYDNAFGADQCDFSPFTDNLHLYQNSLDVYDEAMYLAPILNKALRVIDLETDYSLSPETPNSYDPALVQAATPSGNAADYPLTGKLTLKQLKFRGKGGADIMPPMDFNYDLETPSSGSGVITQETGERKYSFTLSNSDFEAGDLIQAQGVYAVIVNIDNMGKHTIRVVGKNMPSVGSVTYNWQTTKNPPYNKDLYDIWNHYKSDFITYYANENLQRLPSIISSKSTDVWSLRSVDTSLGSTIKIEYESDSYAESVFLKNFSLPLSMIVEQDPNIPAPPDETPNPVVFMRANINQETDINLSKYYSVGQEVDLIGLYGNCTTPQGGSTTCSYIPFYYGTVESVGATTMKIRTSIIDNVNNRYYGGQLYFGSSILNPGGGLRVKSVGVVDDLINKANYTEYEYLNGVTSYEPVKMNQYNINTTDQLAQAEFAYQVNLPISNLVSLGNYIPAPGVMYETVRVKERVVTEGEEVWVPNYSEYQFHVFSSDMVTIVRSPLNINSVSDHDYFPGITVNQLQSRNVTIKDYTTALGSLKRISLFDGNGNLMSETINNYLFDAASYDTKLAEYGNQGVVEETFAEAFYARRYHLTFGELDKFNINGMVTKKEEYPSIQTGQTNINYKTGITTTSSNLGFDFYSGQVTKTLSTDGFGNAYLTQTIPAYRNYAEMGQGANGGKNMLTQDAGGSVFKVDPVNVTNKLGLVSANVQTWSKDLPVTVFANQSTQKIYRKQATYSWKGDNMALQPDGLYPTASFVAFDGWSDGSPTSNQWQKNGEITLYDPNSHALEARDINGNYAATKMSNQYDKVFASAANASYQEFTYTGAEDTPDALNGFYGGGTKIKDGVEVFRIDANDKTTVHTGNKAIRLASAGLKAFEYSLSGAANRTYRASVWTNHADGKIKYSVNGVVQTSTGNFYNGGIVLSSKVAGNWKLVNLDIPVGSVPATLVIWCETTAAACNFDDFRVHPVDGPMTSYVYNQWGELSHILDNQNLYTEFQYDEAGRLVRTFKETIHQNGFWGPNYGDQGIVKVSEIAYNYGKSNEYKINVTAITTGNTGSLSPSTTSIPQGGEATIVVNNSCNPGQLLGIRIDNSSTYLVPGSFTLFDGTVVDYNGTSVILSNTQSPHTVRGEFNTGVTSGNVICHKDASNCPTGSYDYFRRDVCGVESWVYSVHSTQVPPDLQHLIPNDCCDNAPAGCNCTIQQQ